MKFTLDPHMRIRCDDILNHLALTKSNGAYDSFAEAFNMVEKLFHENALKESRLFYKTLNPAKIAMPHTEGCSEIVMVALTLGESIPKLVSGYFEDQDAVTGYLLDIMCDLYIDFQCEKIHEEIVSYARKQNMGMTYKISPGNAIDLAYQQKMLPLFDQAINSHVKLTPSHLLFPIKTVMFYYGLGEGLPLIHDASECRFCKSKVCSHRKEAYQDFEGGAQNESKCGL